MCLGFRQLASLELQHGESLEGASVEVASPIRTPYEYEGAKLRQWQWDGDKCLA